ncbi:hypothetical protein [Rheinheimera soli]|uniref:DUF4962 domain-containing protein n=1 Tax=Rheinheimera soli TaxID=443616 RepID=A0ABU1W4X9_9GAMM|nr:hypothetical protein [Rheinheimera soli]MDR7123013.1 hypothetical protein [Rheinheimera soli]
MISRSLKLIPLLIFSGAAVATTVPAPLPVAVPGISGVVPAPGSGQVSLDITPEIHFSTTTSFGYTGGLIKVTDQATGETVYQYDPEPGDAQERQAVMRLAIPAGTLRPATSYQITAGHLFSRINASPWNIQAIAAGQWQFTTESQTVAAPLVPAQAGITEVFPAQNSTHVPLTTVPRISFAAASNFSYTGGTIKLINLNTGTTVDEFDPETGDPQEGQTSFELHYQLEADTSYEIQAGHLFSRINTSPWNLTAIPAGVWRFSTGETLIEQPAEPEQPEDPAQPDQPSPPESPPVTEPDEGGEIDDVAGIEMLSPAPGQTNVSLQSRPKITFSAPSNFSFTDGAFISVINITTGELVAQFDPASGDSQEGQLSFVLDVPLLPESSYEIQADNLFARINAAPWNLSGIPVGYWQFTTGESITESPQYPADNAPEPTPPAGPTLPGGIPPTATPIQTDLSWTANIPQSHPRLVFNSSGLAPLQQWAANNNFEPRTTTNPIHSSFDPAGNALKYLLTGNSSYADIALQGIINATDSMHQQIGRNTCNQCRWYGEAVILAYDWIYDYIPVSQREEIAEKLDQTFTHFLNAYWGGEQVQFAENNYFWGYFRNAVLWGISNFHERENAPEFIRRAMADRWQAIAIPHYNGVSPSGIPAEGVDYGPMMLYYNITVQQTLALYGRDLHQETPWYRNAAWWLLYSSLPKDSYDNPNSQEKVWSVFPYGDATNFWSNHSARNGGIRQFTHYAVTQWNNTPLEGYLRSLINRTGLNSGIPPYIAAFDDGGEEGNLAELPTDFFISGDPAYLYSKSSWQPDAAILNLQLVSPNPVGHEHLDAGNWQLWKDGVWASRESPSRGFGSTNGQVPGFGGEGTVEVHTPVAHNTLLIDGQGPGFYLQSRGRVLNITSEPDYVYAAVDLTQAYPQDKVDKVKREFLFIKPLETLLILDQVEKKSADSTASFLAHVQLHPHISGPIYTSQNRHVKTEIQTLLPTENYSVRVINEQREHLDHAHRIEVNSTNSELFLHSVSVSTDEQTRVSVQLTEHEDHYLISLQQEGETKAVVSVSKAQLRFSSYQPQSGAATELPLGIENLSVSDQGLSWTNSYQ